MNYSSSQTTSLKKKQKEKEIMRADKRTTQVVTPRAHKDEKLALATDTDGANIKNQCARPQDEQGRTFHCSVCNTTFKSKSDYDDHIVQAHKKRSSKRESRHNTLSATTNSSSSKTKIDYVLDSKIKMLNPAKIVDHSGLIHAENRLIKARYKHQSHLSSSSSNGTRRSNIKSEAINISLTNGSQATDLHNNAITATPSATGTLGKVPIIRRRVALDPDKLSRCSARSKYAAPHPKRRRLGMIDIEVEEQKMEQALSASSQKSQVEVEMDPFIATVSKYPHPVLNDPNNYCRVCHVSHTTQEDYQNHLQTKHHVVFPSISTTKRKAQKPAAAAVSRYNNKLCKYIPIQITFDPKSTTKKQIRDANVQPDLDDPNHYCRSCHITKPNRTSYLTHLCMIHQITSKKIKDKSKAPHRKTKK